MAFGKDLQWIRKMLHCNLSKSGQKGSHVILRPIIFKWANFMDEHELFQNALSSCAIISSVSHHMPRQVPVNIPMRTERARWGDMFGLQRIWCSGLFWGCASPCKHSKSYQMSHKRHFLDQWIERNHIVLVRVTFTMNLTNRHSRGSQTLNLMT